MQFAVQVKIAPPVPTAHALFGPCPLTELSAGGTTYGFTGGAATGVMFAQAAPVRDRRRRGARVGGLGTLVGPEVVAWLQLLLHAQITPLPPDRPTA